MAENSDPIVFYSVTGGVVAELLVLIVWCVALVRTRRAFFWILVFSSFLFVAVVVINALMAYDPRILTSLFNSRDAFRLFYYVFVCVQPISVFLFFIGQLLLVRWMIKASRSSSPKTGVVIDRLIR